MYKRIISIVRLNNRRKSVIFYRKLHKCSNFERMDDIASTSTPQAAAPHLNAEQELNEFREIVWGSNIRLDVFQRWSQGSISFCTFEIICLHKNWQNTWSTEKCMP